MNALSWWRFVDKHGSKVGHVYQSAMAWQTQICNPPMMETTRIHADERVNVPPHQ